MLGAVHKILNAWEGEAGAGLMMSYKNFDFYIAQSITIFALHNLWTAPYNYYCALHTNGVLIKHFESIETKIEYCRKTKRQQRALMISIRNRDVEMNQKMFVGLLFGSISIFSGSVTYTEPSVSVASFGCIISLCSSNEI